MATLQKPNQSEIDYDNKFNDIAKELNDVDENGDKIIDDEARETAKSLQDAENYANDPDNTSRDVSDQEDNPDFIDNTSNTRETIRTRGNFHGTLTTQKKGPILVVILLLLGLGAGGTTIIPGALVSMSKWLTNWSADDHRTLMVARGATIGSQLSKKVCNATGIRCKIRTVGKNQMERLKAAGFDVQASESAGGRFKITKITTPSGAEFGPGEGGKFNKHIRFHTYDRAAFYRALHPKASWFTHPQARFSLALKNLRLNRGKTFEASDKKDKNERKKESDKAFDRVRDQEGLSNDRTVAVDETQRRIESDKHYSRFKAALKSGGRKISAISAAGDLMCMAKTMIQTVNAAVKLYLNRELAAFALEYLKIGDQIQNEGNKISQKGDKEGQDQGGSNGEAQQEDSQAQENTGLKPETVEWAMDNLTWYDNNPKGENGEPNEEYGLTAMDSQGLKAAIYGDYDKLAAHTEQYTTWGVSSGVLGSGVARELENSLAEFGLDKSDIRTVCLALKLISFASLAFTCNPSATGAACLGTLALAVGGNVALNVFADDIVKQIGKKAYENIADLQLNSNLRGVRLGDAFSAGVGTIMQYKNRGSGLKVARDPEQIQQYIAATKEIDEDEKRYALEEAKENQFDPTNQYSFIGRLASFVNPYRSVNSSPFAYLLNAFTLNTASLNVLNPFGATASALYSQPVELTNRPGSLEGSIDPDKRCKDPDLAAIGVPCILPGIEKYITEAEYIKKFQETTDSGDFLEEIIDYMQNHKYIDEAGKPVEEKDNEFKKWIKYCTEQREYPIGVAGESMDQFAGSTETEGRSFFSRVVDAAKKATISIIPGSALYDTLGVGELLTEGWAATIQKTLPDDVARTLYPELITEADMAYYLGARCAANRIDGKKDTDEVDKMIDMFGLYYNMCYSQLAVPEDEANCYEEIPPAEAKSCKEGWSYPTDKNSTTFTSGFGARWGTEHRGVDLAGPIGTPVYAACDGTVSQAGSASGFGQWIVIDHDINGEKFSTVYGHVETIEVSVGQNVKAGQRIGTIGNRGESTGPHLHFEIWKGGRSGGQAVDPAPGIGI